MHRDSTGRGDADEEEDEVVTTAAWRIKGKKKNYWALAGQVKLVTGLPE